jgi:ADP-glucose pyrophosphorylase
MPYGKGARFVSRLTRNTLALILAGGRGDRLKDLTRWRAKPAVPFGGKFRIIDFPLSNCVNSGIRRIGVLTQYKAHSLIRHLQSGWGFLHKELGEFVEILPASQRVHEAWYLGTADALYQNIDILRTYEPTYVLVLAGDHIYKMDYGPMLAFHFEHKADLTIGCIEVPLREAIAAMHIHAPSERNPKLAAFLAAANADTQLKSRWHAAQVTAERLGMSDHSWVHLQIVLNRALRVYRLLRQKGVQSSNEIDYGLEPRDAEVVIAGGCLLHDLGMSIHRAGGPNTGSATSRQGRWNRGS